MSLLAEVFLVPVKLSPGAERALDALGPYLATLEVTPRGTPQWDRAYDALLSAIHARVPHAAGRKLVLQAVEQHLVRRANRRGGAA